MARVPRPLIVVVILLAAFSGYWSQFESIAQTPDAACDGVRYLMQQEITPYDLAGGGGVIGSGVPIAGQFTSEYYADTWLINTDLEQNSEGLLINEPLSIVFEQVDEALSLEYVLFYGMEMLKPDDLAPGYQPVTPDATFTYTINREGAYTVVVRRTDVTDSTEGGYTFEAEFSDGGEYQPRTLRDETTRSTSVVQSGVTENGIISIPLSAAGLRLHAGSPSSISSRSGEAAQVFFFPPQRNTSLLVNAWADVVNVTGGDLAITGATEAGRRIVYIKDYGYEITMTNGDLTSLVDSNGAELALSWDALMGVWVDDSCAGLKLRDGTTFITNIQQGSRSLSFTGPAEDFTIRAFALNQDDTPQFYEIALDWRAVMPGEQVELLSGIFTAGMLGERSLTLDSRQITIRSLETRSGEPDAFAIEMELVDRGTSVLLDWANLQRFELVDDAVSLQFLDPVRSQQITRRTAVDLELFEALEDVIRIVYADGDNLAGQEHLLLSEADSYIEIVTPAGMPEFVPPAIPGEPGYAPRGLNNLGGECYPINTMQPQGSCPPNGYPNPANGNVWYAVTDQQAFGGLIDLTLTRSYNALDRETDGPFGHGWSSPLRFDYDAQFDPGMNSRLVDPAADNYPVGLDLTWVPRGIATFITPSGSRHVFRSESDEFLAGEMQAITMPGWTLTRDSLRADNWILRQDDGLAYYFDRAGRIIAYGYPNQGRMITTSYGGDAIDGLASLGSDEPVIVTDSITQRRLELYFEGHHIVRSVLRDMIYVENTLDVDTSVCDLEDNCFETKYGYDGKYLVEVLYADGTTAEYSYDEPGRMTGHDDPRAPIAARMTYEYDDGSLTIGIDDDNVVWRRLEAPFVDDESGALVRTVSDDLGRTQTFSYDLTPSGLKAAGTTYTLQSETHPLAGTSEFAIIPVGYTWEEGILQSVDERFLPGGANRAGRVSTQFVYGSSPYHPTRIHIGYPEFRANYETFTGLAGEAKTLPTGITYPDGSVENFEYDEVARLASMTNRHDGQFSYEWNSQNQLARVISVNDGIITDYGYDALGLVETVTLSREGDPLEEQHTTRYEYDSLGRLVLVESDATDDEDFRYNIAYTLDPKTATTTVSVTDITGAVTYSFFNSAGQLVEQRIESPGEEHYLRRATYTYDSLGRFVSETRYLLDEDGEATPIVTSYSYANTPELADETRIDGHTVTITDPLGRVEKFTYDALDRIRQVEGLDGRSYRYDYSIDGLGQNIIERFSVGGQLISTTSYLFEARWQLREVVRSTGSDDDEQIQDWEINFDQFSTRLTQLVVGRWQQSWPNYTGRPEFVNMSRDSLLRDVTSVNPPSPAVQSEYDHLGRPLRVTLEVNDSVSSIERMTYNVRYCPLAGGAQQIIYALPSEDSELADGCETTEFARAVTYDAHGRLAQVVDEAGTRRYAYTPVRGGWQVEVDLGLGLGWTLEYDSLGQITRWVDENGTVRICEYDTLGRLISVTTTLVDGTPQPEASFAYTYNAVGFVTSALDQHGSGRGTRYTYDDAGRLVVQQDARTANATIYGYNAAGMLSTLISPLGSSTAFLYEDPGDPTRLTRIVDPTGNAIEFEWDDSRNRLTFRDARGNVIRYVFDRYGALWRVEELDTSGQVAGRHDLRYSAGGSLIEWRQAQPPELSRTPALYLTIDSSPELLAVSAGQGDIDWRRNFGLNAVGQVVTVGGNDDETIRFNYDSVGRLISMFSSESRWSLNYERGLPHLTYRDGFGKTHELDYDALNRLVSSQVGDADLSLTYERTSIADLNVTMRSDLGTQVVTYATGDDAARPTAVIVRTPGQRLTYLYNDEGLLTEITREACIVSLSPANGADATPEAPVTPDEDDPPDACLDDDETVIWRVSQRMTYDPLGRPVRYVDEEQNIESFVYDDVGNLLSYQNANGTTISYDYETSNRLLHITSATGVRLLLDYDDLDRVTGICRSRAENADTYRDCQSQSGAVLARYAYDSLGRLESSSPSDDRDAVPVLNVYDPIGDGLLTGWNLPDADETQGVRIDRDPVLNLNGTMTVGEAPYAAQLYGAGLLGALTNGSTAEHIYTYDDYGRLESMTVAGRMFLYDHLPDGGFTITDVESGASVMFALDSSGFLSVVGAPDILPIDGDEAKVEYRLSSDGRILVSRIPYEPDEDGERSRIELQITQHGEIRTVAYVEQDLFIDFVLDSIGQVQRQSINGDDDFFYLDAEGYIVVLGYDNDDRPLTMRISDRETGSLAFLLNYTYDALGRRSAETRQFGNGQRLTVTYRYDGAQLVRREINYGSNGNGKAAETVVGTGGPLLALSALFFWLLRTPIRRRIVMFIVVGSIVVVLMLSWAGAQSDVNLLIHRYEYDDAGNLVAIVVDQYPLNTEAVGVVCASFSYDSANRLVASGGQGGVDSRQYSYDALNRLVTVDSRQLVYHGTTDQLLASFDGEESPMRFYGQAGPAAPFMIVEDGSIRWLFVDGRGDILGDADSAEALWMFDPAGGYLALNGNDHDEFCLDSKLPNDLASLDLLPATSEGVVWDVAANLYFEDGRVYSPDVGTYLQRDPQGPDVYGNLYTYPARSGNPPRRILGPAYAAGLNRLRDALDSRNLITSLTADALGAQHSPAPVFYQPEPVVGLLEAATRSSRAIQIDQIDLPEWLETNYNLPSAYVDDSGALRLPRDNAPGHGGLPGDAFVATDVMFTPGDHWLPQIMPPIQQLEGLVTQSAPRDRALTLYLPYAWMPQRPDLTGAFANPVPVYSLEDTPGAVMERLPQTLASPQTAAAMLDAVDMMAAMPGRAGQSWVDVALDNLLPSLPELPPADRDAWLATWFTFDTLGTEGLLRSRWPQLPQDNVPVFNVGRNDNWWQPRP